jgi:hypothetical protein
MPITQLTYLSRNSLTDSAAALDEQLAGILDVSRHNNRRDGLTGYLVSDGTWFLQILEGDDESVMAALVRIRFDPRHSDVRVISTRQVRMRSFPQWSLGGSLRTPAMRAIFRRHGLERIDSATLTAPAILLLMMDLQDYERVQGTARRAG